MSTHTMGGGPFEHHIAFVDRFFPASEFQYNPYKGFPGTPKMMRTSLAKIGWSSKQIGKDPRRIKYFNEAGELVGRVYGVKISRHGHDVDLICKNKEITKQALTNAGVPTPRGYALAPAFERVGQRLFGTLKTPLVVKPTNSAVSKGVTVGVETEDELNAAWDHAKQFVADGGSVLVEEQSIGFDLRTFVVDGKFVAGATRIQPFVVGDGASTVDLLIQEEKRRRRSHFQLAKYELVVDRGVVTKQLGTPDYEDFILNPRQILFLNGATTLSTGAVTVEVTPFVCEELKQIAGSAVAAIPGLEAGAVDMIVQSLDHSNNAVVLEVNTSPGLFMHSSPAIGEPVMVTDAFCEYAKARAQE